MLMFRQTILQIGHLFILPDRLPLLLSPLLFTPLLSPSRPPHTPRQANSLVGFSPLVFFLSLAMGLTFNGAAEHFAP